MTSARPPNAAAGKPPPMTLPNVIRSGTTPSTPYQPAFEVRKPVMTSSETNSAPFFAHASFRPWLKPAAAAPRPCCPETPP